MQFSERVIPGKPRYVWQMQKKLDGILSSLSSYLYYCRGKVCEHNKTYIFCAVWNDIQWDNVFSNFSEEGSDL